MNEIRVYESTCRWVRYRSIWDFLATAKDIGWEEIQNTSPTTDPLHDEAILLIQFQPALDNAVKEGETMKEGMVYSQEWVGKTIHSIPYTALHEGTGPEERDVLRGVRAAYHHDGKSVVRGSKLKQVLTRVLDPRLDAEIDEMRISVAELDPETSPDLRSKADRQEYLEGLELIARLRECFNAREASVV